MSEIENLSKAELAMLFSTHTLVLSKKVFEHFGEGDMVIRRIHNLIVLVRSENPALLIEKIGAKLFKYRDGLWSTDPYNYFIKKSYADDVAREPADKRELVEDIIGKVREYIVTLPASERDEIIKKITLMLDIYIEYRAAPGAAQTRPAHGGADSPYATKL